MAKKEKKKPQQTWNSIEGVMKVYGTEVGEGKKAWIKYSTSLGVKDDDDEYINAYLSVRFSKNCDEAKNLVVGENWISITSAFMTVEYYTDKNNKLITKPSIMVLEFEIIE